MRLTLVSLGLGLLAWYLSELSSKPPRAIDGFTLRATVLESIEGGPLIINVILKNRSDRTFEVYGEPWRGDEINVSPSVPWEGRVICRRVGGNTHSYRVIVPGEEWSEKLFLHHHFEVISSGKVRLSLSWPLYAATKDRPLIAEPAATLDLDIPPATVQRLVELRQRLEKQIVRPSLTKGEGYQVADVILGTRHAEFLPVAWLMLGSRPHLFPAFELIYYIHTKAGTSSVVQDGFVNLACVCDSEAREAVFDYWQQRPQILTQKQIQKLQTAECIWTNIRAFIIFGKNYNSNSRQSLFASFRREMQLFLNKIHLRSQTRQLDPSKDQE